MQIDQKAHTCEHFRNLKLTKKFQVERNAACKFCLIGNSNIWMCLALQKGCESYYCDLQNSQHLKSHLEQSRKKKAFHTIFININTAAIVCVHCDIEIYDLQLMPKQESGAIDPYYLRLRVLPYLAELTKNRLIGQLENSEGHKKYNKGLSGLFGTRYNQLINTSIQFLYHISFLKHLVLEMKTQSNQILTELKLLIQKMDSGDFRAIHSTEICNLLYQKKTNSHFSYKRKDPFQIFGLFLSQIHEQVKYYSCASSLTNSLEDSIHEDEWTLLSQGKQISIRSPVNQSVSTHLSLNYCCQNCDLKKSMTHRIDFLKLNIPTKRKKVKEIEKDLQEHRCQSPVKRKGKSLMNLFMPSEPQCPITIVQLLIQFLKHPFNEKLECQKCGRLMKQMKSHFESLPEVLLLMVNRMNRDKNTIDDSQILLQTNELDMSAFLNTQQQSKEPLMYEFQSAICFQKKCLFPLLARNYLNKQLYKFSNQSVQLIKERLNPYMICYRKKVSKNQQSMYRNVMSSITCGVNPDFSLPDFWLLGVQHGHKMPLQHQLVCHHNKLKPEVYSAMDAQQKIPKEVYEALVEKFGGQTYENQPCKDCIQDLQCLKNRKQLERETIIQYDNFKTTANCMISAKWINKWKDFLYKKEGLLYISKGYPAPGPIDNRVLLDDGKCKPDLKKNQQFLVVKIFVWKFLKEIYGGGPQIRYKWNKNPLNKFDEELIKGIKQKAQEIKHIYIKKNSQLKTVSMQRGHSIVQEYSQEDDDLPQD